MNALTRYEPAPAALIPFDDITRMGQVMAASKLFGIQSEPQAVALMLLCQSENLHPATAMRDYHLIGGRPALKAEAMLARFQAAGGKVKWNAYTDDQVSGTFSHPAGESITVEWTPARVKQAQIQNPMHAKYPRQMLKARCISEGIRAIYPGVLSGMYAPEELRDFPEEPAPPPAAPEPPAKGADALKSKLLQRKVQEQVRESLAVAGAMPPEPLPPMDLETGEILPAEPADPDPVAGLLDDLGSCQSRAELEGFRAAVAALKGNDKRRAVAAWKATEAAFADAGAISPRPAR